MAFKYISSNEGFPNYFKSVKREYYIKNQHPAIKKKFDKTMIWTNSIYKGIKPVIFDANSIKLPSDLTNILMCKLKEFIKNFSIKSKHNFEVGKFTLRTYFQRYLKDSNKQNNPYGWNLLIQKEFKKLEPTRYEKSLKIENDPILNTIWNNYMIWIHEKYNLSFEIPVNSNLTIEKLVEILYNEELIHYGNEISPLNNAIKKKYVNLMYTYLKEYLLIEKDKFNKNFRGWCLIKNYK